MPVEVLVSDSAEELAPLRWHLPVLRAAVALRVNGEGEGGHLAVLADEAHDGTEQLHGQRFELRGAGARV